MIVQGAQKTPRCTVNPVILESSSLWDLRDASPLRQATSAVPGFQAPGKYEFISTRAGTRKPPTPALPHPSHSLEPICASLSEWMGAIEGPLGRWTDRLLQDPAAASLLSQGPSPSLPGAPKQGGPLQGS